MTISTPMTSIVRRLALIGALALSVFVLGASRRLLAFPSRFGPTADMPCSMTSASFSW